VAFNDGDSLRLMTDKLQPQFTEILDLIKTAQDRVIVTSNQELIKLYWSIGKYIPEIASALRTQLNWTHHRIIMSRGKTEAERLFYIQLTALATQTFSRKCWKA
jgi:hypothetical protein